MDKPTLLRDMRRTHAAIDDALARLDDVALLEAAPGLDGWTRRDVLVHLEWWSDHSARVTSALVAGREPYDRDAPFEIDAHNARVLEEGRARTVADVRAGEAAAFARVLAAVEAAPEDALFAAGRFAWLGDDTLAELVASDTSAHYPEHLPHLT